MDSSENTLPAEAETLMDDTRSIPGENGDDPDGRHFGTKLPLLLNLGSNVDITDENVLAKAKETPSSSSSSRKRSHSTMKMRPQHLDDETREKRFKNLMEVIKRTAELQQDISKKVHQLHAQNIKECGLQNQDIRQSSETSSSNASGVRSRLRRRNLTAKEALRKTPSGLMVPIEQPLLLEGAALRNHQLHGFKWLQAMDINVVNGILGDEMGLGKTLQVIAMICLLIEKGFAGPYVIIAPLSIVPVWIEQFKQFAPKIPTMSYTGTLAERRLLFPKIKEIHNIMRDINCKPVVICPQHMPIRDPFLETVTWRYMVVDEGHRLNNPDTKLHQALLTWRSNSRCILTGTPLQNDTRDLWSLMNFLMPQLFDKLDSFDSWFSSREFGSGDKDVEERLLEKERKTSIATRLREILSPFLLRRLKSEVDLGIPPKTELILTCPMTEEQAHLYNISLNPEDNAEPEEILVDADGKRKRRRCVISTPSYVESSVHDDENDDEEDFENDDETLPKFGKENASLLGSSSSSDLLDDSTRNADTPKNLRRLAESKQMMTLRHIANHPQLLLRKKQYTPFSEELIQRSSKLMLLDAILKNLKKHQHKVLIFSFFTMVLDLIEELMEARGYKYCRIDGQYSLESRKEQISDFTSQEDYFAFIMTTRTGGLGLNLVEADTVIFFDNDWNPHIDLQAEARCHRIGQTKPVAVYRLAVKDTVDIVMLMRAEGKQKLSELLLSKNALYSNKLSTRMTKYTIKMFKKLLESKSQPLVEPKNGINYTDDELEQLLDRSKIMEVYRNKN